MGDDDTRLCGRQVVHLIQWGIMRQNLLRVAIMQCTCHNREPFCGWGVPDILDFQCSARDSTGASALRHTYLMIRQ